MNNFAVNPNAGEPVYLQIQNQIRFAIASGELSAGDRLPPVLRMAQDIGVNLNTVAKAYRDLELRGLIYTKKGVGCYVCDDSDEMCRQEIEEHLYARACVLAREASMAGFTKARIAQFLKEGFGLDGSPYDDPPPFDGR